MASNSSPRKVMKAKRVLPSVPPESPRLKSVHFNSETIETSIGGTQRVGKIKQDVLLHFGQPVSTSSKTGSRNTSGQTTPRTKNSNLSANSSTVHSGKENKKVKGAPLSSTAVIASSPGETSRDSHSLQTKNAAPVISSSADSNAVIPEQSGTLQDTNNNAAADAVSVSEHSKQHTPRISSSRTVKTEQSSKNISSNTTKAKTGYLQTSQIETDSSTITPSSSTSTNTACSTEQSVGVKKERGSNGNNNSLKHSLPPSGADKSAVGDLNKNTSNSQKDRRTTMERIDAVCQSPFRTPSSREARRHTLESKVFSTPDCYRDVSLGTPRRLLPSIQDDSVEESSDDPEESSNCSIMVAVRVRPFVQR